MKAEAKLRVRLRVRVSLVGKFARQETYGCEEVQCWAEIGRWLKVESSSG